VSQWAEAVAVQGQPAPVAIVTVPDPPDGDSAAETGEIEYVHPLACEMRIVCPAIVAVPVRSGPVFAAMASATADGPLPDDVATVIHGTALDAVQVHAAPVTIDTAMVPAAAPAPALCGPTA
jgi:hypothetical protein